MNTFVFLQKSIGCSPSTQPLQYSDKAAHFALWKSFLGDKCIQHVGYLIMMPPLFNSRHITLSERSWLAGGAWWYIRSEIKNWPHEPLLFFCWCNWHQTRLTCSRSKITSLHNTKVFDWSTSTLSGYSLLMVQYTMNTYQFSKTSHIPYTTHSTYCTHVHTGLNMQDHWLTLVRKKTKQLLWEIHQYSDIKIKTIIWIRHCPVNIVW